MASTAQNTQKDLKQRIIDSYITLCLEENQPQSVYAFCQRLKIDETDFYQHFGSFPSLEKAIWAHWITSTLVTLKKDKSYQKYTIREKILAFYFTHFEQLKSHRSYILMSLNLKKSLQEKVLSDYRNIFIQYCKELTESGIESNEIASRKYLQDWYGEGFWLQLLFVLQFWMNDDSPGFEKTDAAIEKAVNLSFELISPGPLEAMVDFTKFIIQNR